MEIGEDGELSLTDRGIMACLKKAKPQNLSSEEIETFTTNVERIRNRAESKLPGLRAFVQWLCDFEKAAKYAYSRCKTTPTKAPSAEYRRKLESTSEENSAPDPLF